MARLSALLKALGKEGGKQVVKQSDEVAEVVARTADDMPMGPPREPMGPPREPMGPPEQLPRTTPEQLPEQVPDDVPAEQVPADVPVEQMDEVLPPNDMVPDEVLPEQMDAGGTPPGGKPPTDIPADMPEGTIEGPVPGVYIKPTEGGSTRNLANPDVFDDPVTKKFLEMIHENQTRKKSVPWVDTIEKSKKYADNIEAIMGKPPSQKLTAGELHAINNSITTQANEIDAFTLKLEAQIIAGQRMTVKETGQMQMLVDRLQATESFIAGELNEAAVFMNANKIPKESSVGDEARAFMRMSGSGGGPGTMEQKVLAIVEAGRRGKGDKTKNILDATKESFLAKTYKTALTVRYNMMLSSVRSHDANILGSMFTGLWESTVVRHVAAVNDALFGGIATDEAERAIQFADIWIALGETIKTTAYSAKVAKKIAMGEITPDISGKFANEFGMRIRPIRKHDSEGNLVPRTGMETAELIATSPTRLLEAEDAFFKSQSYANELSILARRHGRINHPGDIKAQKEMYKAWLDGGAPDDIKEQAIQFSQKITFTNDPNIYGKFLGSIAHKAIDFQKEVPGMNVIVPFVKTPANITNYALEQAGIQQIFALSQTKNEIFGRDRVKRANALARLEIAVGISLLAGWLVEEGNLTGIISTDYNMVKLSREAGVGQNSIQIDGKSYDLSRLDPPGLILGMAASAWELKNEMGGQEDTDMAIFAGTLLSISDLLLDRQYLQGFGTFFDIFSSGASGKDKLVRFGVDTATSFVTPGIVRDFRELTDPEQRSLTASSTPTGAWRRAMNKISNATPILSKGLNNALDWRGQINTSGAHAIVRGFAPLKVSNIKDDPATTELLKQQVFPRKPKPIVSIPGTRGQASINLLEYDETGRVYAEYLAYIGQERWRMVEKYMNDGGYQQVKEEGYEGHKNSMAADLLRKALRDGTKNAQVTFFGYMSQGSIPSKIMKDDSVKTPDGYLTAENLESIMYFTRGVESNVEDIAVPGVKIKKNGSRNIPKALMPKKNEDRPDDKIQKSLGF